MPSTRPALKVEAKIEECPGSEMKMPGPFSALGEGVKK